MSEQESLLLEMLRPATSEEMDTARYWFRLIFETLASQHRHPQITSKKLKAYFEEQYGNEYREQGYKIPNSFSVDGIYAYARLSFRSDSNFRKCFQKKSPHNIIDEHLKAFRDFIVAFKLSKTEPPGIFGPRTWARLLEHAYREISECSLDECSALRKAAPSAPERGVASADIDNSFLVLGGDETSGAQVHAVLQAPAHRIGRSREVQRLVDSLSSVGKDDFAAVVFGAPAVGKTTLTKEVACHDNFVAQFGTKRFFVELEHVKTANGVREAILAAAQLSVAARMSVPLSGVLSEANPSGSLFILDNLETPWEEDRQGVEAILRDITSTACISILASVRGTEVPADMRWSDRLKLEVLEAADAKALFSTFAPMIKGDDPLWPDVLEALGGLPLALELVAIEAAPFSQLDPIWAEWSRVGAALAQRRDVSRSRLNSLEMSLELSLHSPRRSAGCIRVFFLLAYCHGSLDAEACRYLFKDDSYSIVRDLLRSGLAYQNQYRIALLPPVTAYAETYLHLLTEDDIDQLISYYFLLAKRIPDDARFNEREFSRHVTAELEHVFKLSVCAIHRRAHAEVYSFLESVLPCCRRAVRESKDSSVPLIRMLTISHTIYGYATFRAAQRRNFHEADRLLDLAIERLREKTDVMFEALDDIRRQLEDAADKASTGGAKMMRIAAAEIQNDLQNVARGETPERIASREMESARLEQINEATKDDPDLNYYEVITSIPVVEESEYIESYGIMLESSVHHVGVAAKEKDDNGDFDRAIELYSEYAQLTEQLFGHFHAWTAFALTQVGRLYDATGRFEEAQTIFSKVETIENVVICSRDLITDYVLATLWQKLKHFEKAASYYEYAYACSKLTHGPYSGETLIVAESLADMYLSQERYDEAEKWYAKALAGYDAKADHDLAQALLTRCKFANSKILQDRLDDAIPILERIRTDGSAKFGWENEHVIWASSWLEASPRVEKPES